jgi:pSer/pThr/pTyr-binding forkhead associated (FHA) protein
MSLLELGDKRFTIPAGEVALGSDASCAIALGGPGVLPRHALLQAQADGQVIIRKASPAADVMINGVRLGAEPTPLLHGDKVEVGMHELTFVDERRSGSTQFVPAFTPPPGAAPGKAAAQAPAAGTTGGRVVSLTDGREYVITGRSLVFGREAGCDVVVSGKDVSRRHAEIVQTPKGYLLVDSSTNGTLVNETLVAGQRILVRGDVIRLGEEQFRFYTDLAPASATAPPTAGPPGPAASAPAARPPTSQPAGARGPAAPPVGAGERLKHTLHGMESATPAAGSQVAPLANFLVRTGALKGQRLQVKVPVANIGRADYNDLVLPDPSVSTSHAKLQRREGIWVLVDLESTNGTFVDSDRIAGESPLAPGALVRFGDVQLVFEPTDDALGAARGGGTQVIAGFKTPTTGAAPATPPTAPPRAATAAPRGAPAAPPPAPAKPAAARAQAAAPAAPAPPKAAPKPEAKPTPKPAAKRPAAQQPPEKKGKGCGASAVVFLLGGATLAALLHQLLF